MCQQKSTVLISYNVYFIKRGRHIQGVRRELINAYSDMCYMNLDLVVQLLQGLHGRVLGEQIMVFNVMNTKQTINRT